MAKAKQEKPLCVNDLRHAEYYGMQESFDDLYARSQNGEKFTHGSKAVVVFVFCAAKLRSAECAAV